jgi:hypothetical protein
MLKLTIAILAFAVAGCAMPMWTSDAAAVQSQFGMPVRTMPGGEPVTARDWNCKCHCKSCFQ